MRRWRGLKALVVDAVDQGSRAVERIQIRTAKLPFELLERIPPIATPVKGIHTIYDTAVTGTHVMIRLVTRVVGETVDVVLDVVEKPPAAAPPPPSSGGGASEGPA